MSISSDSLAHKPNPSAPTAPTLSELTQIRLELSISWRRLLDHCEINSAHRVPRVINSKSTFKSTDNRTRAFDESD